MKPVIQKEKTGCGIASVAALAGISYQEAKATANSLGIFAEDTNLWSDTRYVRVLLKHFGIASAKENYPFHHGTYFQTWHFFPSSGIWKVVVPFGIGLFFCVAQTAQLFLTPRRH